MEAEGCCGYPGHPQQLKRHLVLLLRPYVPAERGRCVVLMVCTGSREPQQLHLLLPPTSGQSHCSIVALLACLSTFLGCLYTATRRCTKFCFIFHLVSNRSLIFPCFGRLCASCISMSLHVSAPPVCVSSELPMSVPHSYWACLPFLDYIYLSRPISLSYHPGLSLSACQCLFLA